MAEQVAASGDHPDALAAQVADMDVDAELVDDDGEYLQEDEGTPSQHLLLQRRRNKKLLPIGRRDDEDEACSVGEDLGEEEEEEEMVMDDDDDDDADDNIEEVVEEVEEMARTVLRNHGDALFACAVAPRTRDVVTGGGDDKAFLYRAADGYATAVELGGHSDSVTSVGFSHDGALAATGGYDGLVQVWRMDGSRERGLEGPSDVEWLRWHPKGDVLLCGSSDGTAWMWMARSGECLRVFAGHDGPVSCGVFTCDGKGLATGSADGTLRLWAPKKGTCKHVFEEATGLFSQGAVTALACHPADPDLVACCAEDGTAHVLHLKAKRVVAVLAHSAAAKKHAHLSSHEKREAVESDLDAGEAMAVVAVGLYFDSKHPWAATGGVDGALKIWDFSQQAATCRHACPHDAAVTQLQWHPDRPRVYTASADKSVRLFDARSGNLLLRLTGHTDVILALDVAFASPADDPALGDLVVSAGDDKTARVFDVKLTRSATA